MTSVPDWATMPNAWVADIPSTSSRSGAHVPGLTDMPVQFDEGPPWPSKTYHTPAWYRASDRKRLRMLRKYATEYGRDLRLRQFVVKWILQPAGILFPSRQYEQQAAALLKWVQSHIAYLNEPGELLQSPWHTLKVGNGDCDDMALLLAAMAESLKLPWRFVLGGPGPQGPARWAEGTPKPLGVNFAHIYLDLGWPPFRPQVWVAAEPTMPVPLGYDVARHGMPGAGGPGGPGVGVRLPPEMAGPWGSPWGAWGAAVPVVVQEEPKRLKDHAWSFGKTVLFFATASIVTQVLLNLASRNPRLRRIMKGN